VRDKHGRLVQDLQPGDFQLLDDGKPVPIKALRAGASASARTKKESQRRRFLSLLLDDHNDATQALGLTALTELEKSPDSEDLYISIWEAHDRVRLLHSFSNNYSSLRQCLMHGKHGLTQHNQGASGEDRGKDTELITADRSTENTLVESERSMRQQQLRPTIAALLALATEQRHLPSRKALILFSDGAQLNAITEDSLRLLVSQANRSQVSFYTVNTSGISDKTAERQSRLLMDLVNVGHSAAAIAQQSGQLGTDTNWDLRNKISQGSARRLQDLAAQTGGVYKNGPTNLSKFVRSVAEESLNFHEAVYYQPISKEDGHFRTISVHTLKPGLKVQSRSGSFAVFQFEGEELSPFEIPLLNALNAKQPAETILFSPSLLRIGQDGSLPSMQLAVEVPLSGLMAKESDVSRKFGFRLSLLALIKDSEGKIVAKVSRSTNLEGALEQLSQARRQSYRLEFPVALLPGKYEVNAALEDGLANKISTKTKNFTISGQEPITAVSAVQGAFQVDAGSEPASASLETFAPQVNRNAAPPAEAERKNMLDGARQRAIAYGENLPNFVCTMVTRRSIDPRGRGAWMAVDTSTAMLTYVNKKETVVTLDVNGRPARSDSDDYQEGAAVKGEFGALLSMLFSAKAKASITWEGEAELMGAKTAVFRFTVTRPNSEYLVIGTQAGEGMYAAYHALVFVDAHTLGVRRVAITADNLPEKFSLSDAQIVVDYDYLPVSNAEYLLPVHAGLLVRQRKRTVRRNEIDFQNYRKYGAESRLVGP
ncbi:MAG: VWA domain-containing protein, partial [Acidobacteriaceae bacterium]|nr:VWA domain-containing protein [Acidobacteriaceae bacterium]